MERATAGKNIIFGLVLLVFSLLAIIESIRMPTFRHREGIYAAPGLVPLLLGVSLLLMAVSILREARKAEGVQHLKESIAKREKRPINSGMKRIQLAILYLGVYVFLMLRNIPYIFSTSIFLFIYIYTFYKGSQKKRIIMSLLISVITTAVIVFLFSSILRVRLP